MKKFLFMLLGAFMLSTTGVYAQELTAKEKAKQKKEAQKQEKKNAKKEAKIKKAKEKDAKIEKLRADYAEFLAEYQPIEANTEVAEVDSFFVHTNELFALLVKVEDNTGFIEMVPEPYFDEEMGTNDTIWNARNAKTGEPIKKSDALKTYTEATLDLTLAASQGLLLTTESVSALAALTADPSKALLALSSIKKVKQATKSINMSTKVIPLIQRNIKENTEKLKYKKANEGQEEKE